MSKKNTIQEYSFLVIILLSIYLWSSFANASETSGVLVTAESSEISELSNIDIRRIYLGLPVDSAKGISEPVINKSNLQLYSEFIRSVMRMTEKGYKRKLVKRVFRQGSEKIVEIYNHSELVEYLKNHPGKISFMSEQQAKKTKGIKVIQPLW